MAHMLKDSPENEQWPNKINIYENAWQFQLLSLFSLLSIKILWYLDAVEDNEKNYSYQVIKSSVTLRTCGCVQSMEDLGPGWWWKFWQCKECKFFPSDSGNLTKWWLVRSSTSACWSQKLKTWTKNLRIFILLIIRYHYIIEREGYFERYQLLADAGLLADYFWRPI